MKNNIKELRVRAGLSQKQLADRMGATDSMISRLESGARRINAQHMPMLCKILRATPSEILGEMSDARVKDVQIAAAGAIGLDSWSATPMQSTGESVPVITFGEFRSLSAVATIVEDDSVPGVPVGAHLIHVPYDGARGVNVDGDFAIVMHREGRVSRSVAGRIESNQLQTSLTLPDGEKLVVDNDSVRLYGLVVGVFWGI